MKLSGLRAKVIQIVLRQGPFIALACGPALVLPPEALVQLQIAAQINVLVHLRMSNRLVTKFFERAILKAENEE